MKTILFTGGGTAGHIMPNIALIEKLKDKYDCFYAGTDGMEKKLIKENFDDVTFFEIKATKFVRKLTLKNLLLPFKMLKSVKDCKKLMRQINPSLVFAKGGYVSYPVAKAAKKLKIPLFIHESDFSVGLANKLLLKKCDRFFTTFSDTAKKAGKKACPFYLGPYIRLITYQDFLLLQQPLLQQALRFQQPQVLPQSLQQEFQRQPVPGQHQLYRIQ